MTPIEKAEELVYNMCLYKLKTNLLPSRKSKKRALIAVEEILIQLMCENESNYEYWQEVKKEIEKTL